MTTLKLKNLLLRCTSINPYTGNLSKKENIIHAIELGKVLKKFADDGYKEEAMDIESNQWESVINELEKELTSIN